MHELNKSFCKKDYKSFVAGGDLVDNMLYSTKMGQGFEKILVLK